MTRPRTPLQLVTAFASLLIEVEAGVRPARHLRPMLAPELQTTLRRVPRGGIGGGFARVHKVLVQTRGDRCEAVVLLARPERTTALIVSLMRDRTGWLVVDLARPGEDPVPDLPPEHPTLPQIAWHRAPRPEDRPQEWQLPAGWQQPHRPALPDAA
ncbi:MAG: Rv3235 family protein [Actinomycetota bacterium]